MQIDENERERLDAANPNIWTGAKCPRCGGAITKMVRSITTSWPTPKSEGDRRVTRVIAEYGSHKGETVIEYEHTIVASCKPCGLGFTTDEIRRMGGRV